MKSKFINKRKLILIWVIIYIIVVIFGITISGFVIYKQNRNLISIAYSDLAYYEENATFAPLVFKHDIVNVFYDRNMNRVDFQAPKNIDEQFGLDAYANNVYPKVQEKGMHYKIIVNFKLDSLVSVAIALPYGDDGMFLFFKELHTLNSIFKVLFPSVSLMFVVCAAFSTVLIKKNRDFERMQREYVDNISHELKSPIASVQALTTGIYEGMVTDENKLKNHCSIMLGELNRLEHTVSDMLELSRIQNHQINCDKEICTITDLFGDILAKRRTLCEDLNIEFILIPEAEAFPLLYTNKVLARRMMDILLDNAIKFTPVDGRIVFNMTEDHKQITIAIKDSGPGIHPDDQPLIFKRFYKSDKSHNEKGSGLGLAIAKEIADSLGEKLWLKSSSDEGAEFAFTIHKS